jgi:hypothetical protein
VLYCFQIKGRSVDCLDQWIDTSITTVGWIGMCDDFSSLILFSLLMCFMMVAVPLGGSHGRCQRETRDGQRPSSSHFVESYADILRRTEEEWELRSILSSRVSRCVALCVAFESHTESGRRKDVESKKVIE